MLQMSKKKKLVKNSYYRIRITEAVREYELRTGRKMFLKELGQRVFPDLKDHKINYRIHVLSCYNHGRRNCPIKHLVRISEALGVSLDFLVDTDITPKNEQETKSIDVGW